jgi:2,5-furandicarboxylate decarboxylase 1
MLPKGEKLVSRDLRAFLDLLEGEGEIVHVYDEVDPKFEVEAVLRKVGRKKGPAVIFENVKGYKMPIVGNLLGSEKRLSLVLGCSALEAKDEYLRRKGNSLPPKLVAEAPVKDVVYEEQIDILKILPVLTHHEKDAGPYITQGLVIIKDPLSGNQSLGIHRVQVRGPNRLTVQLISKTSLEYLLRAEERGQGTEVAVIIGVSPAILLASMAFLPGSTEKLTLAGSLQGQAVEITKGITVDLKVPARAMIVLEGRFIPGIREEDGPFGETTGYYTTISSPVVEVKALYHQSNCVYPVVDPWSIEHEIVTSFVWSAEQLSLLKSQVPGVRDIRCTNLGAANLFISLSKRSDGEARQLLYTVLASSHFIKTAMVVDEDVDIYDDAELLWAYATRVQPAKDVVLVEGVSGCMIDPSAIALGGLSSKMGIDATKPLAEKSRYEKIAIPVEALAKADQVLSRLKL